MLNGQVAGWGGWVTLSTRFLRSTKGHEFLTLRANQSCPWVGLGLVEFSGFLWVGSGRVVLMFIFKVVIILQHKKCICVTEFHQIKMLLP